MKKFVIAILVVAATWQWWVRQPAAVTTVSAPPETRIAAPESAREAPIQHDFSGRSAFTVNDHELRPLAEYAITARVLRVERYHSDRGARLSPLDLALGWGNMSRQSVTDRISVSQSGRWYYWRYSGEPPIPRREIERSSANVHIIPASRDVAKAMNEAYVGRVVRLRGYLVEARGKDGWIWRSSLTRADTGDGSCELMFVQAVQIDR